MKEVKGKQREVLDAIAGGARTPDAVAHATKFEVSCVYTLVYELKKKKMVKLDKDGDYVVAKGVATTQPTKEPKKGGRSLSERTKAVLSQLREDEEVRLADVAAKAGLTQGQVQTVIRRCVDRGNVVSTSIGKYQLTKSGAAIVAGKGNGNGHAAAPDEIVMEPRSSIPEVRRIQDLCTMLFDATRTLEPRVMSKKKMALLRGLTQELD